MYKITLITRRWLALHRAPLIGSRRFHRLLAHFGTPRAVFAAGRPVWEALNLPARSIDYLAKPDWARVDADLAWLAAGADRRLLTLAHPEYPIRLREVDDPPALLVVTQRPRELTRQQLKELGLALDAAGYAEATLQSAWCDVTNQDIAASIIGFVRRAAIGDPLVPYAERVDRATAAILGRQPWTKPQREWLIRIANQLKLHQVVDPAALDADAFQRDGGFARADKIFDGKLAAVLGDLQDALWHSAG